MKKNVLQLIGSFHQGGSERQAVQLIRLLKEDGRCNVFVASLNNEGALRGEVEALGFSEIPELKLTSFYDLNFLKQLRRAAKMMREKRIDVVHTHDFYTNIFGILAARLARVSVRIASKRETGGMRSRAQMILENQIFKMSSAIVVNSEAVKNYLLEQNIPARKLNVIYNGLDAERLKPKTTERREICEKLNLPADEKIRFITLVANLRHRVKNQPMFLRAAQQVIKIFPDAHFVLAGEGELKPELEKIAADLHIASNTHFIGSCREVPELLSVSYACALCSYAEGFSNSILEYMQAGKPVVATNVGGASEAIAQKSGG